MRRLFYLVTDDDECFDETGCSIYDNDDAESAFEYANLKPERGIYLLDADVPSKFDFTPYSCMTSDKFYGRAEMDRYYITCYAELLEDEQSYCVEFRIDKSNLTKLDK